MHILYSTTVREGNTQSGDPRHALEGISFAASQMDGLRKSDFWAR